jgi:hypothetical protein
VTGRGSRCSGDYLIAFAVFYVEGSFRKETSFTNSLSS